VISGSWHNREVQPEASTAWSRRLSQLPRGPMEDGCARPQRTAAPTRPRSLGGCRRGKPRTWTSSGCTTYGHLLLAQRGKDSYLDVASHHHLRDLLLAQREESATGGRLAARPGTFCSPSEAVRTTRKTLSGGATGPGDGGSPQGKGAAGAGTLFNATHHVSRLWRAGMERSTALELVPARKPARGPGRQHEPGVWGLGPGSRPAGRQADLR
jgi:hypothetical protein